MHTHQIHLFSFRSSLPVLKVLSIPDGNIQVVRYGGQFPQGGNSTWLRKCLPGKVRLNHAKC